MAGGIEAGRLKDRVTLSRPFPTRDEYGQDIIDWDVVGVFYAEVVGNGGGTALSVGRSSITYNHTVRIRNSSRVDGITAAWRLEWKSRVFEVSSVVEADGILTIECADEKPASVREDA